MELDYWRRISRCEVPGLAMDITENSIVVVGYRTGNTVVISERAQEPHHHRAAAMLVVDALEAAGLAWFARLPGDLPWWWISKRFNGDELGEQPFYKDDGKEHLALLSLLADVCEAM